MKILHVLRAPVGGLFRHVCDLATEQARQGHSVGILYDATTSDALTADRLATLESVCTLGLHRLAMSREVSARDVAGFIATRTLVRRLGVDIVHGHGAKGGALARLAAYSLHDETDRPRAYYTPHGGSLHYDPASLKGRFLLGLERQMLAMSDGLVFESAYSARTFAEKVGLAGAPHRIVPNGLLPEDFAPHEPDADAADFLFIGELRQLKGVDVLLEALARLDRPVTACVVGAGPDRDALQTMAMRLGLAGRVTFAGAMPASQAFRRGRCLVVPSRAESFPYIVLEAAAAGVPLIASDVGGISEIAGETGCPLVVAGDADALARQLERFLDAPADAAHRTEALRVRAQREYSVSRMAAAITDFYLQSSTAEREAA
jgi:glycosyltransferase involved in cell wall biosynthesis